MAFNVNSLKIRHTVTAAATTRAKSKRRPGHCSSMLAIG